MYFIYTLMVMYHIPRFYCIYANVPAKLYHISQQVGVLKCQYCQVLRA